MNTQTYGGKEFAFGNVFILGIGGSKVKRARALRFSSDCVAP